MLGFDGVFDKMCRKDGKVEYASMPVLCQKILNYVQSNRTIFSLGDNNNHIYEKLQKMLLAANTPQLVQKVTAEVINVFDT